jgi:agmatine deiminase
VLHNSNLQGVKVDSIYLKINKMKRLNLIATFILAINISAVAQTKYCADEIKDLKLQSISGQIITYYSEGKEIRASELKSLLERASASHTGDKSAIDKRIKHPANTAQSHSKFYMPAEWEPHDAVWLGWEAFVPQYHPAIVSLIKTLSPTVIVKVAASSDSLLQVAKKYLNQQNIDSTRIKFYVMPGERYWIRDHGAAFLVNQKGELGVADFGWDRSGFREWLRYRFDNNQDSIAKYWNLRQESTQRTAKVDSLMAVAEGATILKTKIIHEGGAIEVNGKGTLILCEATVLQRNIGRSREEIEEEFKRVLGVTKIIWLKKGLAEDLLSKGGRFITGKYFTSWGTGGHTDEFVRFANANTIFLAWVNENEKDANPVNRINYERMNENLKILENATDQDGKPFKVIKVPLPDLITNKVIVGQPLKTAKDSFFAVNPGLFKLSEAPKQGDTLIRVAASSYLNYLVTNGLVVLPTYVKAGSSKQKEEAVKKIFKKQFPDRRLVFIDVMPQNWEGGGIHCSTQQQPKRK